MKSRPAVVQDIYAIDLQPVQALGDPRPSLPDNLTDEDLQLAVARTIDSDDGRPIACCGATPRHEGVAEVWGLFSLEALEHHIEMAEEIIYWMDKAQREHGIRRMQATADEDHAAAHRYLLRLGFEPEGRMPGYGMFGQTCWMYGRLR